MGSGKSTVGRIVAERSGRDFLDLDQLVEAHEGCAIAEIFEKRGEAAFRAAEWAALRSLDGRRGCVVATGGGLYLAARRRRWIRERGTAVWLDAPLEVCAARVRDGAGRPLWTPDEDRVGFRMKFETRRAAYALADIRVTSEGPPEGVAAGLLERVELNIP